MTPTVLQAQKDFDNYDTSVTVCKLLSSRLASALVVQTFKLSMDLPKLLEDV